MPLVIGHSSAVEFWRTARPDVAERLLRSRPLLRSGQEVASGACSPDAADAGSSESSPLPVEGKPSLACWDSFRRSNMAAVSFPLHAIVAHASDRLRGRGIVCHVHSEPFPHGSLLEIDRDLYVASPEVCFLHAGSELDFAALLRLGFELCGRYRLVSGSASGFREALPLTTPESIAWFLEAMGCAHGAKQARRALPYLVANSGSPMETVVASLLCLPVTRGGRGLPFPEMNGRVWVAGEASRYTERRYFECDLLWRDAALAVEYDSDAFHTGSARIARDAARRNALAGMGIVVMTMGRRQLLDYRKFNEFVRALESRLGVRRRAGRRDWTQVQFDLWRRLTTFER